MKETIYVKYAINNVVDVTKIITIYYFERSKEYAYEGEVHDFWEINYIDRGDAILTYDEKEYAMKQSDIVFLQPNHFHGIRANGKKPFNMFIISFEAKSNILDVLGGKIFKSSSKIKEIIQSIIKESNMAFSMPMENLDVKQLKEREDAVIGSQQIIRMRIEELIILLLRQGNQNNSLQILTSKSKFDDHIAQKTILLLEKNIYNNLNLSDIISEIGYGKTYLSNVFKRVYGVSIMAYYMNLKIEEAKYLLRENTMTIKEISEKLGFSSPQYFSRRFSQLTQMSPQQYVQSVKDR